MSHHGEHREQRNREPESIYDGDTDSAEENRAEENFDDETQNPDLPPGTYPSDPSAGDATTPPPDEARKDAEKPR